MPTQKIIDESFVRAMPKADLHCHLDGSLRLETILELASETGVRLPTKDKDELRELLHCGKLRSLESKANEVKRYRIAN